MSHRIDQYPARSEDLASEKLTIKPDDGHGFFYLDGNRKSDIRDTELGKNYTADAILQRTGIEKELYRMHLDRSFKLSIAQEGILRPDYPDKAETRRLLLQLSPVHNKVVKAQLDLQRKQELTQRQLRRMRLDL